MNISVNVARSQILSNLLADLAQFTDDDEQSVIKNMQMSEQLMRSQWYVIDPKTVNDVNSFYATDATMPYRLTWQLLQNPRLIELYASLPNLALKYVWHTVLDYDTEIGTAGLVLAELASEETVAQGSGFANAYSIRFADWKVGKYQLPYWMGAQNLNAETHVLWLEWDCIICTNIIGRAWNPYRMLAEVACKGHMVVWLSDFGQCAAGHNDFYPAQQVKPPMWDKIFFSALRRLESYVYSSLVYGKDPDILAEQWIAESGWKKRKVW